MGPRHSHKAILNGYVPIDRPLWKCLLVVVLSYWRSSFIWVTVGGSPWWWCLGQWPAWPALFPLWLHDMFLNSQKEGTIKPALFYPQAGIFMVSLWLGSHRSGPLVHHLHGATSTHSAHCGAVAGNGAELFIWSIPSPWMLTGPLAVIYQS